MNVADSDQMLATLAPVGYQETKDSNKADLILINTCSVREKPENKMSSFAHELKKIKLNKKSTLIGVTGCVAQQEKERVIKKLPFVDFVLGPDNIDELPWIIAELGQKKQKQIVRTEFDSEKRLWKTQTKLMNPGPTAFVSIMKGCDHFCSYCIVPMTRGREKSRPMADIISDTRELCERGVKEITFLGQNINTFGKRAGESLHELFYKAHEIEKLKRIRFTTSHPGDLKDELVQCFRDLPKLCSQFHLPVQSGSDRILRSMRRFYSVESYLEKVYALREARPDIAIGTDIIIGFPGEDEKDFQKTIDLVEKVKYDYAFSFIYSARPGTSASTREDTTPMSVKKERLQAVQAILKVQSLESHQKYLGKTTLALVEGPSKKNPNRFTGRNSQNIPIHFDKLSQVKAGDFIELKIKEAHTNYLLGEEILKQSEVQANA